MNKVEANFVYTQKQAKEYSPQEYSEDTPLGMARNIVEAKTVNHIRRNHSNSNLVADKEVTGTREEKEYIWGQKWNDIVLTKLTQTVVRYTVVRITVP